MDDELRRMRIELQDRFDTLREVTGINLNANYYEKRQCKTYLRFFRGLDILLGRQGEVKALERKSRLTAANLAEVSGIAESTIEHNRDFRAIVAAVKPKDSDEPVILFSEHKRVVNELKELVKEKDRRLDAQRKVATDLALERTEHERTKRALNTLQDSTENLYRKLGLFLDEHPEAAKAFTDRLPDVVMLLPFRSKEMS